MFIPRISRERDPSHLRLKVTLSEGLAHHDAHALLPGLTSSWGTALVACCLLVVPQRRAGVDLPFLAFDVALAAPVTPSADRGFQHRLAFLELYTDATSGL
jgi:hypothetical protein